MVSKGAQILFSLVWATALLTRILPLIIKEAYVIRLGAIEEFGPIIHEFDPYFNLRATEYLYEHGYKKFFTWFDYKSWYPLGRPVGTTIYPGMQFTAVFIKTYITGDKMSLNDVCCYIPAWFGVIATFLTGLIAYECSLECNSSTSLVAVLWNIVSDQKVDFFGRSTFNNAITPYACAASAAAVMAIIPAHLMRSVGGGYDNESVAMTAMSLTFYFWVRSLRAGENRSYLFGILTGVAYFYMAATWGGYVFVLNMIGLHAALMVALGRFSTKVYLSYSLFYVIGTFLAIQVPVVGLTPLKSLEQLGAFGVFLGYQVLQFCEMHIRKHKMGKKKAWIYRIKIYIIAAILGITVIVLFTPTGYFGPISSRVRGLFVKHTKTGNPLVDSVAEHQPAKANSYYQYLHHFALVAPLGLLLVLVNFGDAPCFAAAYGITAYFFSHKMVRLILLLAPGTSILGGIVVGRAISWAYQQFVDDVVEEHKPEVNGDNETNSTENKPKKAKKTGKKKKADEDMKIFEEFQKQKQKQDKSEPAFNGAEVSKLKRIVAAVVMMTLLKLFQSFHSYSWELCTHLSNPSIIQVGRLGDGTIVHVDDYREAYNWIRENTEEDARIMAWWDYGYQIASIANRTTIADGNTWNHEHIALLAKILTGPTNTGHAIARHMADYMLVWAGGGGDDVAKSPHLARIAQSVFRDMCADPTCSRFGMERRQGQVVPSKQMTDSLIYNLVNFGIKKDAHLDPSQFRHVHRTKYGKVRIYRILNVDQESKDYGADPKNRDCDVEGGWYCRGKYPPALVPFLNQGKDFAQLEDFNKDEDDSEYQKRYHEQMAQKRKQDLASKAEQSKKTFKNKEL